MFTTLALCLAPVLQDGAALHSADAAVFIELPDVPQFVQAWRSSALPSILGDEALSESLTLAGLPDMSDFGALVTMLPPEIQRDVLPILQGIQGISFSAQVDLSTLESVVQESVVAYQVHTQLQQLSGAIIDAHYQSKSLPANLQALGLSEAEQLDPFGNPIVYTITENSFELMSLGADGAVGGEGLASDWDSTSQFPPYIVAQLAHIAGLELVVEWNDVNIAGQIAGMAGMFMGRLASEMPFATITGLGTDESFPSRSFSVQPSDVNVAGIATPIEFSFLSGPTRSVIAIGNTKGADVASRIAAATAGTPAPSSLAVDQSFVNSVARVHRDGGAVLWQGAVRDFGPLPQGDSVGDALGKVGTFFGLLGFQSGAWQTRLVDGKYITDAYSVGVGGAGDLNAVAALIPNDAVLMNAGKVDPLGIWSFLEGAVQVDDEEVGLEGLQEMIGVDVRGDLLANMGHQYAAWFQPVNGLAPPSAFFVTPVKEAEKVMAALDKLADLLVTTDEGFRVSRRPYKGINYTTLDVGIPIGFRPSFCVIDDMLWLSNSSTLLKRTIRMHSKGDMGERGNHPLLVSLQDESGALPAKLESAFYADAGSILAAYYGAGRSFAGMIPTDAGVPPGLIDSLPDPDIFTRNIPAATSWTVFEDGALMTHKEGAFGPEPVVLGFGIGLGSAYFMARIDEPSGMQVSVTTPIEQAPDFLDESQMNTELSLQSLELGLLVYSITNGDYPAKLDELLESTKAYPQGYLGMDALPSDGWGAAFIYERVSKDAFKLYSIGANRTDDQGAGDDVASQ